MKDFLTRLAELAGTDVANQIISEYGGQPVYIRRTLSNRDMVKCQSCANTEIKSDRGAVCTKTKYHVCLFTPRICRFYRPIPTNLTA